MATLKTISAALKLIDSKKENLKKAFDDLQSHSSLLSSFSLTWSELDSHFTSLQNSLNQRFQHLESLELQKQAESTQPNPSTDPSTSQAPNAQTTPKVPPFSSKTPTQMTKTPVDPDGEVGSGQIVKPRPELKAFCENMDGLGLRKFLIEYPNGPNERKTIRDELPGALLCAPDPAALVLDAMDWFYKDNSVNLKNKNNKDWELGGSKRCCVLLLEELMKIKANVREEVRERAKELALKWIGKERNVEMHTFEVLGFLHLVAAYGLRSVFNEDDLVDYHVIIAQYRQSAVLCKVFGLGDKAADLIQKLVSKGKQLQAVKFIFEFELTEKFPPVPLLKAHLEDAKKAARKVVNDGNHSRKSLNEGIAKEVGALKSVIKVIEDHNLDSEYPRADLEGLIAKLQKRAENIKKPAAAPPAKSYQPQQHRHQQQQQSGNKRPRMDSPVSPAAAPINVGGMNSTIPQYQQSHLQSAESVLAMTVAIKALLWIYNYVGGKAPAMDSQARLCKAEDCGYKARNIEYGQTSWIMQR
ncbi:truncated FRIGIDA-like protein 1 isoform X2 [Castanea sativa]|uniref:truncated FRIGIDA-like protein 1 isoform X2 n=1 Tax=Castanea sativa TaxID=21020 RepID=UPI003F653292